MPILALGVVHNGTSAKRPLHSLARPVNSATAFERRTARPHVLGSAFSKRVCRAAYVDPNVNRRGAEGFTVELTE